MKSIRELRNVLRFQPQEINSSISYFAEKLREELNKQLIKQKNVRRHNR